MTDRIALRAAAIGGFAVGSMAIGALAVGALAIGRLAIGRLVIGKAEFKDLRVGRLEVREVVSGSETSPFEARPEVPVR
jgi:hypothetical protein